MTQEIAESVKDLAKDTVEALGVITERECPECEGRREAYPEYAKGPYLDCSNCSGTGKFSWKWEPKESDYFLCSSELILLPQETEYVRWFCKGKTLTIQYSDGQRLFAEYNYPLIKCIPILHWEEIERVLEGVGYTVEVTRRCYGSEGMNSHCLIESNSKKQGYGWSESRQRAVMWAVIKLGEEIK